MGQKVSRAKGKTTTTRTTPDPFLTTRPLAPNAALEDVLQRTEEVLRFVPNPALFQVLDNLSAGLILANVVPHAVVPALVTEHVLGPFLQVPSMAHSIRRSLGAYAKESAEGEEHGDLHLAPWLGSGEAELEARLPELSQYCSTFQPDGFGYVRSPWDCRLSPGLTALYHLADWYHGPQGDISGALVDVSATHYKALSWYQMPDTIGRFESDETNDAVMRVTRNGRPDDDHPFERSVAWVDLTGVATSIPHGAPHLSQTQPRPFQNLRTIIVPGFSEVGYRLVAHLALVRDGDVPPSLRCVSMWSAPHFFVCALARSPLGRRLEHSKLTSYAEDNIAEYLFWFSDQCPVITDDDRSLLRRSLTLAHDHEEVADQQVTVMVALLRQQTERYPSLEAAVAAKKETTAIMCRGLPLTFTHLQQLSFHQ